METKSYPLIVIGAGAGGLVVANGFAKTGKKVLLIEKGTYGGDCTNFGCIPSKSLIASAEVANTVKNANKMGILLENPNFNADEVFKRVQKIVENFKEKEDPAALKKNGVDTLTGKAEFVNKNTLKVLLDKEEVYVSGKKIIIATGSSPIIPPINGIDGTPYLTNETIFSLKKIPKSMIVIGGGPIGCELAQAFNRLGTNVSIVHKNYQILNREEQNTASLIKSIFEKEGIAVYNDFQIDRIGYANEQFELEIANSIIHQKLQAETILISAGREPNLKTLNLSKADIESNNKGVIVDCYGRTTQKHIYAIGDVAGPPFFTHLTENRGRIVLSNLILPWPFKKKINLKASIPRVTYTDPEIASVGLTKKAAYKKYTEKKIAIYQVPFSDIDRAVCQGKEEGFIQIITKKWSSKILGVTIVGARAGELLGEVLLAIDKKIKLRAISDIIHPYPTFSLGIRQAADLWLKKTVIPKFFHKK